MACEDAASPDPFIVVYVQFHWLVYLIQFLTDWSGHSLPACARSSFVLSSKKTGWTKWRNKVQASTKNFSGCKNRWVRPGNATITDHRPTNGTERKRHQTIDRQRHTHESNITIKVKQPAHSSSMRWLQTCKPGKATKNRRNENIEDIYFLRWVTNIFHWVCWKHQNFHECKARVKILMFSTHEMKYTWYLPKKYKFSFYFILLIGYMQCLTHGKRRCWKCKNEIFSKPK